MSRRGPKGGRKFSKEDRINYIMEVMRKPNSFRSGCMYPQLMAEFDVGIDCIKQDCAEASRNVRREINDPDLVALDVGKAFQDTLEEAMKIVRGESEGDIVKAMNVVNGLGKSWAQITGADVPQRIELVKSKATPEKALEIMKAKAGHVTPKGEE